MAGCLAPYFLESSARFCSALSCWVFTATKPSSLTTAEMVSAAAGSFATAARRSYTASSSRRRVSALVSSRPSSESRSGETPTRLSMPRMSLVFMNDCRLRSACSRRAPSSRAWPVIHSMA